MLILRATTISALILVVSHVGLIRDEVGITVTSRWTRTFLDGLTCGELFEVRYATLESLHTMLLTCILISSCSRLSMDISTTVL